MQSQFGKETEQSGSLRESWLYGWAAFLCPMKRNIFFSSSHPKPISNVILATSPKLLSESKVVLKNVKFFCFDAGPHPAVLWAYS